MTVYNHLPPVGVLASLAVDLCFRVVYVQEHQQALTPWYTVAMVLNFIGCPSSGKTTTASMLFASLKETGVVCEFSSEQARLFIAKKKLSLKTTQAPSLSDGDQLQIMTNQLETDEALVFSCGKSVLVLSDSSPLNSMLYMSPALQNSKQVQDLAQRSINITAMTFVMSPVFRGWADPTLDPNRIHSDEQSKAINQAIPDLLKKFPTLKTTDVFGNTTDRLLTVQSLVLTLGVS